MAGGGNGDSGGGGGGRKFSKDKQRDPTDLVAAIAIFAWYAVLAWPGAAARGAAHWVSRRIADRLRREVMAGFMVGNGLNIKSSK